MLEHHEMIRPKVNKSEHINFKIDIGSDLPATQKEEVVKFPSEFKNVFAWWYEDMPSLNTDVVVHRFPLKPDCNLVKQKLRRMKLERTVKIKKELVKHYDAGFLEVVDYSEWLANIAPVPKKYGKVKNVCGLYRLNKSNTNSLFLIQTCSSIIGLAMPFSPLWMGSRAITRSKCKDFICHFKWNILLYSHAVWYELG